MQLLRPRVRPFEALGWSRVMELKGDGFRIEVVIGLIVHVHINMVTGSRMWTQAVLMYRRRALVPVDPAFVYTAPPVGASPWRGPTFTAGTLGPSQASGLTLALIVRIFCYPMLMSNVLTLSVAPPGAGPKIAAPRFSVILPAGAGKRILAGASVARLAMRCMLAAATAMALAVHPLKEAVTLGATLDRLTSMVKGPARSAGVLSRRPLAQTKMATLRMQFVGAPPRLGGLPRAAPRTLVALQLEGLDAGLGRVQAPAHCARTKAEAAARCPVWVRAEVFSHRVPRRRHMGKRADKPLSGRGEACQRASGRRRQGMSAVTWSSRRRKLHGAPLALDTAVKLPKARSWQVDDEEGQKKSKKST